MQLLQEAQIKPPSSILTGVGIQTFYKGFETFSNNQAILENRGNTVLQLRVFIEKHPEAEETLSKQFQIIKENESVFEPADEWKNTSSEQIFFAKGGHGELLNQTPVIGLLTFYKIWLAPLLGVLSPVLLCIVPYLMLVFVYKMEISWAYYQTLLLDSLIGPRTWNLNTVMKIAYFLISLSQTMIQPFFTAKATYALQQLIKARANKLRAVSQATDTILRIFKAAGIKVPKQIEAENSSDTAIFAQDKDENWKTQHLAKIIGTAEVLFALAKDKRFRKPQWCKDVGLQLSGFADISISSPKLSSVSLVGPKCHSLLTGPNRGGKSSNLRGVLQNVLWAQSYGLAPSRYKATMFDWIECSLRSEDRPGVSSLFEREIEIAAKILKRHEGKGLVLIDEIFHSTNPPDGERTARLFLSELWKMTNIVSCVSTHVYAIVEDSPAQIQRLCCWAKEEDDGKIQYDYVLREGICRVSSVNDVLREKGLCVKQ